ncbi:hypothetical protein CF319_g1157 [Tilletia indica]|uniref:Uncharacterized protein n=1 Tax=Tilletia indica TaxID=43049 RepID=A0A177T830_9BASI|nr:hypothetical protein CF319_g1157 [Tilletia indica]KAE8245003.1 hypothetical protein A4X13_0g6129 [Tilletia indica]
MTSVELFYNLAARVCLTLRSLTVAILDDEQSVVNNDPEAATYYFAPSEYRTEAQHDRSKTMLDARSDKVEHGALRNAQYSGTSTPARSAENLPVKFLLRIPSQFYYF